MLAQVLPSTIRGRLAATSALLAIVLVFGFGAVLVYSVRARYENRLAGQLEAQARMAATLTASNLAASAAPAELDKRIKDLGAGVDERLTIIDGSGAVVADSEVDPGILPSEENRTDARTAIERSIALDSDPVRSERGGMLLVAVPVPGSPGLFARASASLDDVDEAVTQIQTTALAVAIVTSWALVAAALVIAGRITGPLEQLRRHAVVVAAGDFDSTVVPADTRELRDLGLAFNAMTQQVRELVTESERSRKRLEAIFANLSDGVVVIDANRSVVGINAAAARIFGARLQWALSKPFVVVARDGDLHALVNAAFHLKGIQTATIDLPRTGKTIDAIAQAIDVSGEPVGILVVRDVSELRRLEAVRRDFVANVSHELRTPLASIRALVETLEDGAIDDPEVSTDFLRRVVGEVDR